MEKHTIKNYCINCKQQTNHSIEGNHQEIGNPDEYQYMIEHSVVKCRGCNTVSFRKVFHDYEGAYPEFDDKWVVPQEIETFPKAETGNLNTRNLPEIVEHIYQETCNAYRDGSFTLAGIGFRATIEAICNDQGVSGKELSTRINNLASKGLISKKDSIRLHSIRFLGNDAAHEIITPSKKSLEAALIIVEHLITTVYILDKEAEGKLEAIIEEYSKFENLLDKKLEEFSNGDEYPLAKFLGRDMRLISGSSNIIENKLKEKIGKSEYKKLKFGKKAKYLDSREELQYYIVA